MPRIESDLILFDAATVYDPWSVDHIVIPIFTTLNGIHPVYSLLLLYLWESYETLAHEELSSLKDSLLVDPIQAILGAWAGWMFCLEKKSGLSTHAIEILKNIRNRAFTNVGLQTMVYIIVVTLIRSSVYASEDVTGPKKYIFSSMLHALFMFYFFYRTHKGRSKWHLALPIYVALFVLIVHYITDTVGNTFHVSCIYWGAFNIIVSAILMWQQPSKTYTAVETKTPVPDDGRILQFSLIKRVIF